LDVRDNIVLRGHVLFFSKLLFIGPSGNAAHDAVFVEAKVGQ
jgi:hypothetical protein